MVNKSTNEMYLSYSKEFPFWIINPENKPTVSAFNDFRYNKMIFYNESNIQEKDYLFRYSERTYDSLTIISKDPDIKYIWLDRTSSTPIVEKPFLYEESGYYLERVSFYAVGVWKMEFKRDLISLWLQFLYNIDYNNLGNIRTLTTRTNLISDNYQFEDEKLKSLPLKISGWKLEELTPADNLITKEERVGRTKYTIHYSRLRADWSGLDVGVKINDLTFEMNIDDYGSDKTSFCEYYVFNTEKYGMLYIPRVDFSVLGMNTLYVSINTSNVSSGDREIARIYNPQEIEQYLVNNFWANQFVGIYILPNWITTSISITNLYEDITVSHNGQTFTFSKLLRANFGINTVRIKSINYQIPQSIKINATKNNKLGVNDSIVSQSILQSFPIYLNYANSQINFQKYPGFFDISNNIMVFEYDFIFNGTGIATYFSKYEQIENWIKTLPGQLPSSTSKFAQYIQANQNVLQTGIWVKQEEAKVNMATGIANALTGAAAAGLGVWGATKLPLLAIGDRLGQAYAQMNGSLGVAHGGNQMIQGITNAIRAENEVKFEKARVKAKYVDTFNSSTRQINYSQSIDALSREFTEGKICDVLVFPIIDNKVVYNDTIVRCGNKTYEYFKLNELLTISGERKYNYFEVNAENFYKETTNYQKIWDHFTFEEISQILEWLEEGIRIWNTKDIEYDYQE